MKICFAVWIILTGLGYRSFAQQPLELSIDSFLTWVRECHPVAKQAALLPQVATAQIKVARGGFDPYLYAEQDQKNFDGKNYFTLGKAGIEIPTSFGPEIKTGFLWSNGRFLNPEENLPERGQYFLGMKIPLLQGLVFDDRRSALRQAILMSGSNRVERQIVVNHLLADAAKSYWEWVFAERAVQILREALNLATVRLDNIRQSFKYGDKPAVDTVEAWLLVQDRQIELNEASLTRENARLSLSNYLWSCSGYPLNLQTFVVPGKTSLATDFSSTNLVPQDSTQLLDLIYNLPQIEYYRLKQQQLTIDRKLKQEKIKPKLNLEYNLLGEGFELLGNNKGQTGVQGLFLENYKWGLGFSMNLLLRKERGELDLNEIKQKETELDILFKTRQLWNKLQAYQNTERALLSQHLIAISAMANYETLLSAERQKFEIGESSVFMMNSREQKLVESRLKVAKLETLLLKNRVSIQEERMLFF